MGTDVVGAGLEGADTINKLLGSDKFVFEIAILIIGFGIIKYLFGRFSGGKEIDDEVSRMDQELVDMLAKNGYDADGNRLEGYEYLDEEEPQFERRQRSSGRNINTSRISSRHNTGEDSYDRRPAGPRIPDDDYDS